MNGPECVCVGSIIIDDIVYPDGRTSMGVPGGGGVHTAAGMTVWDERPGLMACQGTGLPEAVQRRLERDFDLQGVVQLDLPQIRGWQIFEWDGKRTEIFRVEVTEPFMTGPYPESIPASYRTARGACILREAPEFLAWRAVFPDATILWEPEQMFMVAENREPFRRALPAAHIVSPNLLEASLVYGLKEPGSLADAMLADGASVVALRLGELGSLVASANERFTIPPVPVPQIVDQTGAGNTYCGAFLVGWLRSGDLRLAGCYGAVAASFALETVGVLDLPDPALRDARLNWLLGQVH